MWLFGKEEACCVRGFKDQNASRSCARAARPSVLEALQQVPPCSASWGVRGAVPRGPRRHSYAIQIGTWGRLSEVVRV